MSVPYRHQKGLDLGGSLRPKAVRELLSKGIEVEIAELHELDSLRRLGEMGFFAALLEPIDSTANGRCLSGLPILSSSLLARFSMSFSFHSTPGNSAHESPVLRWRSSMFCLPVCAEPSFRWLHRTWCLLSGSILSLS